MADEPFLGQIFAFPWGTVPKGWQQCKGQLLSVSQNQALFSLLGTAYGGNGSTTFGLPNLQGAVPLGAGNNAAIGNYPLGQAAGEAFHSLTVAEMPSHSHTLQADATTAALNNSGTPADGNSIGQSIGAPDDGSDYPLNIYTNASSNNVALNPNAVGNNGAGAGHENRQPYLALNFCIATVGIYPSRP